MTPTQSLYSTLELAYGHFNDHLFDGELPDVIFTVTRKKSVMGYFCPDRWSSSDGERCHELAINPQQIANHPLVEVLQTMVHEQAHCWQFCFGKPSRSGYHNKEFAWKMEEVGLMPSSTGRPGGKKTGQNMADYPIPNSPFTAAAASLVKEQKFSIPWVDRFSASPDVREHVLSILADECDLDDDLEEVIDTLCASVSDLIPDLLVEPPAVPVATKTKYHCEGCDTNLWGKAGVEIDCVPCDIRYKELTC